MIDKIKQETPPPSKSPKVTIIRPKKNKGGKDVIPATQSLDEILGDVEE